PETISLKSAGHQLGDLVKGSFRGIKVLKRGVSPRIVSAEVIGTGGTTTTDGATLRDRLGLFDTWAYFTTITSGKQPATPADSTPAANPQAVDPSGGTVAGMARF